VDQMKDQIQGKENHEILTGSTGAEVESGEIISLNFQTGKKIPPVADGKIVELTQPEQPQEPSRILVADAQGNIAPPKPPPEQPINLTPFPDGFVFKFTPHPTKPGAFVVHDVNGNVVAICSRFGYADLICNAVRMLFMAAVEDQRQRDAAAIEAANAGPEK